MAVDGSLRWAIRRWTAIAISPWPSTPTAALDTTFNASGPKPGVLTTSTDPNDDEAYGVAIQSDGKIVVAGYG